MEGMPLTNIGHSLATPVSPVIRYNSKRRSHLPEAIGSFSRVMIVLVLGLLPLCCVSCDVQEPIPPSRSDWGFSESHHSLGSWLVAYPEAIARFPSHSSLGPCWLVAFVLCEHWPVVVVLKILSSVVTWNSMPLEPTVAIKQGMP